VRDRRSCSRPTTTPRSWTGRCSKTSRRRSSRTGYAYFEDFLNNFYNTDKLAPERISDRAWQNSFIVATDASPFATYACVDTWLTDFRDDLPNIDVPVLVVHGTEDRILPIDATANRLPALIKDLRLVRVDNGPHNVGWTHHNEVNEALLAFLNE
jgi:non-heme chloroperoxidase